MVKCVWIFFVSCICILNPFIFQSQKKYINYFFTALPLITYVLIFLVDFFIVVKYA